MSLSNWSLSSFLTDGAETDRARTDHAEAAGPRVSLSEFRPQKCRCYECPRTGRSCRPGQQAVTLSPSRHVQDTGLLPTFGQPGWLIAPIAALPHDRATLVVPDRQHPGSHALPHVPSWPPANHLSRLLCRLRRADCTLDNRFKTREDTGNARDRAGPFAPPGLPGHPGSGHQCGRASALGTQARGRGTR